ncbi:hypothetical protein STEG23_012158 [Scotinomys teguina]
MPNAVQKLLLVMDKRASGMNDSLELLQYNENLPSSPGYNSCDEHMELDDLPDLQAVQSDPTQSATYQLSSDVSHQDYPRPSWSQNTSDISENVHREDEVDWLTELANIATSPQSPLMQCSFYNRSSPVHITVTSKSLHSYAHPPPVSSSSKSRPASPHDHWKEEAPVRHERANTHNCASTRKAIRNGKMLKTLLEPKAVIMRKEEIQMGTHKAYGSDDLKLLSREESVSFDESVLKLTFDPGTVEDGLLTVECKLDHPFYVKSKGVFDAFKSYDFTPMDSSTVYVLSSMAHQRRASLSCGGPGSAQEFAGTEFSKSCGSPGSSQLSSDSLYAKAVKSHSSGTVNATSPNKCKRPMNAFMLFAKKYRVEYTQMYSGKDNRAISVILGDRSTQTAVDKDDSRAPRPHWTKRPTLAPVSEAKMGRRQCKSAYNIIKNKTTPESSPPPTPKSDYCNADKAEENDLKKSLMKMLEEAFEEKMKNVSKEIGENTNKKLEEINKEIEEKKSKKLEEMNNEIEEKKNKKLEEMNNEIEEKKNKRVEEMNKEIEEKRNKKLQELDKEMEEKINKKLKEMNKEIEEKTNKKLEEINKVIEEKTNKKLDEINKEIEDKTNKKLEKINKEIDGKKTKELEEMKKEIEEKVNRKWGK